MSYFDHFDINNNEDNDDNTEGENNNVRANDNNDKNINKNIDENDNCIEDGESDEQLFPYPKESTAIKNELDVQYVLPDTPREVVEVRAVAAIIDIKNPNHYTIKNGCIEKIPLNKATQFIDIFNKAAAAHKPIPLKYEHDGKRRIKALSRTEKGELVNMDDTQKFLALKQGAAG